MNPSICSSCGAAITSDDQLCPFHHQVPPCEEWAEGNKQACDLIHRKVIPPKPTKKLDPEDDGEGGWIGFIKVRLQRGRKYLSAGQATWL